MPHWRQKPRQKSRRAAADILRDREARRTAALAACVAEIRDREGREVVTHRLVAERVGVPVQYVQWRFPSLETLMSVATLSSGDGGIPGHPEAVGRLAASR